MSVDEAAARFDRLRVLALDRGAAAVGCCGPTPFADTAETMRSRLADGSSAGLGFTYKDPATATELTASFPWARSVVVVAWPYVPAAGNPAPSGPGTTRVARFAESDHYVGLDGVLDELVGVLVADGYRADSVRDDDRLVDRAAAVRAGIGWWGKSTLVLVPGHGPWVLLGSVITDAPVARTDPTSRNCGTCTACIPACPTGAIVAPGVLDARRCLAAIAQAPGIIPPAFRSAMGDRLYGCDDCLDACPPGHRVLDLATRSAGRHDLSDVLGASDDRLMRQFGHFYIPQRNPRFLRRNALVAAGNSGDARLFLIVAGFVGHPDPLLRLHAAWALRRLDSERAQPVLRYAAAVERDETVAAELEV